MIKKYLTGPGARVLGTLLFIGLATSGCAGYFAGHVGDGTNQVSIAGSCNPSGKFYNCTGTINGQLVPTGQVQGQAFNGQITGCTANQTCVSYSGSCRAFQTNGTVNFAGSGTLGSQRVTFTVSATAHYGSTSTLTLVVKSAQPPGTTLFTKTFTLTESNVHITITDRCTR